MRGGWDGDREPKSFSTSETHGAFFRICIYNGVCVKPRTTWLLSAQRLHLVQLGHGRKALGLANAQRLLGVPLCAVSVGLCLGSGLRGIKNQANMKSNE